MNATAGIDPTLGHEAGATARRTREQGAAEETFEGLLEALEAMAAAALLPTSLAGASEAQGEGEAGETPAGAAALRRQPLPAALQAGADAALEEADSDSDLDEALRALGRGEQAPRVADRGAVETPTLPADATSRAQPGLALPVTPAAPRERPVAGGSRADVASLQRERGLPQVSAAPSPDDGAEESSALSRWAPWQAGDRSAAEAATGREAGAGAAALQRDRGGPPSERAEASLRAPVSDAVASDSLAHTARVAGERAPTRFQGPAEVVVPERVAWLTSQGGGSARVVLHPAELGEVEIAVRVRGDRVDVAIRTEQVATRTALLEMRDSLGESFAARELRVESLEIRVGEARPSSGGDSSGQGATAGRDGAFANSNPNANSNAEDGSGWEQGDPRGLRDGAPPGAGYASEPERSADAPARLDLHV